MIIKSAVQKNFTYTLVVYLNDSVINVNIDAYGIAKENSKVAVDLQHLCDTSELPRSVKGMIVKVYNHLIASGKFQYDDGIMDFTIIS